MLNEYTYVIIELIISILCLILCKCSIKNKIYTWKTLCMKCLYLLWCSLLMIIYVLEYYNNYLIYRYIGLFLIVLLITILFINILNFIFSIFMERKHKRIHFILNYVSYLSDLNIQRCYEINMIIEICFYYLMYFSLGSITLSFITSYYFDAKNITSDIYLFIKSRTSLYIILYYIGIKCLVLINVYYTYLS